MSIAIPHSVPTIYHAHLVPLIEQNTKDTYEIKNPPLVGRDAGVLVIAKPSGRNAFRKTLTHLGYPELDDDTVNRLFRQFKDLCDRKRHVTSDDIVALVDTETTRVPATYTLESVQFQSGSGLIPE